MWDWYRSLLLDGGDVKVADDPVQGLVGEVL
jgi:hypothetical protein